MNVEQQLAELRERLERLEREPKRTHRGRTKQAGAARYLGVSEETLRQWRYAGKGPRYRREGRYITYSYDDLDAEQLISA
jgi:hypothetical protein